MSGNDFKTPIILLIYKRPKLLHKVLSAIEHIRPNRLLVVGDGPHQDRPEEIEQVSNARSLIENI